jgi:transcriptional regulator with XRE-family HTH domain
MFSAIDLVDRARAAQGGISDYRIAKILGIHPNSVSGWRTAGKLPSNPIAMRLAELAGVDPVETMLAVNIERSTTPADREAWEKVLARVSAPTPPKMGH